MKFKIFVSIFFALTQLAFAQDTEEAIKIPERVASLGLPNNIFISQADHLILGPTFESKKHILYVKFVVTEKVLSFSATNNYLIRYNKEQNLIEYGCFSEMPDAKGKSHTIVNGFVSIPAEKIGIPEESTTHKNEEGTEEH